MDKFKKIEERIISWMAVNGIYMLRISVGIIFFWFGFQKFFPGISSAEDIATRTIDVLSFGIVQAPYSMPILATWESLIGLGFITGKYLRTTVILLYLQMAGTIFPLFVFPDETFYMVPLVPTIEGQYILKNIILITAAMVILAWDQGRIIAKDKNDRKKVA
ncbi:MAG: DoxX family membrane protein [Bacteroidetes bacterium]|nr:MAG: DoxX family membrane protein [Bacteroidota bacterium]